MRTLSGNDSATFSKLEVPIPHEFKILARIHGISEERLIRAVQRFLVLEAISMNSELDASDAKILSRKVGKKVWESL